MEAQLEEKKTGGDLMIFSKCLKGKCSEIGVIFFSQATSASTRGNGLILC